MHVFVLIGSGILVLLGIAHVVLTLRSGLAGGPMTPTDPSVRDAMAHTGGLGIAPHLESTLWRAWTGFNLSHALGLIVTGLLIGGPVANRMALPLDASWWVLAAVLLPAIYLGLSVRYWFSKPTQAIAMAWILVLVGVIGQAVTG